MASDIAHALQGAGCPVSGAAERLRGIACVRGPGAFTGLRLALSTVLGLHKAWGTPLAGLDYLPLLVRGAGAAPGENVWVLTHSRNRQVYVQGFHSTQEANAAYVPLGPPDALDIETVTELVCAAPGPCRVLGSGLRKNFAFFSQSLSGNPQLTLLPESFDTPSATLLLQVAAEAHYTAAPIPPLYLRASDAEDNLCEIAQKHGYDPEVAAQLLAKKTSD